MESITQRRTSAASAGFNKPAGAMNSAFDTGAKVPKQRGGNTTMLPPLDLSTTKAVKGPPPGGPTGKWRKGKTRYDELLDTLTADGMGRTGIPAIYKQALASSGAAYLKARPELARTSKFTVRADGEGLCGIWRVAREGAK